MCDDNAKLKRCKKLLETPVKADRNKEPPKCRLCPIISRTFVTADVFSLPALMEKTETQPSGGNRFGMRRSSARGWVVWMHDYFYGAQSEQFAFIRVPTILFTDDQYKYVSAEAKILYGILLARMDLSAKNGWIDDKGRVYIICTLSEIMEKLNCADNKATKLMNELEDKCGLIERKRQGLGKPNLIYVKNFLPVDNRVESRFKTRENHDSGVAEITIQDSSKSRPSNKEDKYIDLRYAYQADPSQENAILDKIAADAKQVSAAIPVFEVNSITDYESAKHHLVMQASLSITRFQASILQICWWVS